MRSDADPVWVAGSIRVAPRVASVMKRPASGALEQQAKRLRIVDGPVDAAESWYYGATHMIEDIYAQYGQGAVELIRRLCYAGVKNSGQVHPDARVRQMMQALSNGRETAAGDIGGCGRLAGNRDTS